MANNLDIKNKSSYISKRYIRVAEVASEYQISGENIRLLAIAAGAFYKAPKNRIDT